MGYVDDVLGGYENLVYDEDGCIDWDASHDAGLEGFDDGYDAYGQSVSDDEGDNELYNLYRAAVLNPAGGCANVASPKQKRKTNTNKAGKARRKAARLAAAAAASGAAAAAVSCAAGLNALAEEHVRRLVAQGTTKNALDVLCKGLPGGQPTTVSRYESVPVPGEKGTEWRSTVFLSSGQSFKSASKAHSRKAYAESDAAGVAVHALLSPAPTGAAVTQKQAGAAQPSLRSRCVIS
jgi:hypothetical protein